MDLKIEAGNCKFWEWKTGFRLPSFAYLEKWTRIAIDQPLRVFFIVSVMLNGFETIAITS